MMNGNMKSLLARASEDEELRAKLEPLIEMEDKVAGAKAILALASEAGVPLTLSDLTPGDEELDQDELGAVTGGKNYPAFNAFEDEGCICPCSLYGLGWTERDWYEEFGYPEGKSAADYPEIWRNAVAGYDLSCDQ